MLWQDENKTKDEYVIPDDIVDISYSIRCKQLPTTHAWELSQALYHALPWLQQEQTAGIHQIHGATSGNGWLRPPDGEIMHLSKRTRLSIRIPSQRIDDANRLVGQELDIAGYQLEVGTASVKKLSPLATIFSRYVVVPDGADEEAFVQWVVDELKSRDIHIRKLLCGIGHTITLPGTAIETRSVMIADLDKPDSISIQQQGIGPNRHFGCGIFMPHKGIRAVGETEEKSHFSGT